MNILMVLTSHDQLGDTGKKTGFWLEEFAAPYYVLKDTGHDITLASPKGGQPPLDPKSDEPDAQTEATKRFKADAEAQAQLASTETLSIIDASSFHAVFYPGGHGPLWDLANDPKSKSIIETTLAADKPVALVNTSPRAHHAFESLQEVLRTMNARLLRRSSLSLPLLGACVTEAAMLADAPLRASMRGLLATLQAELAGGVDAGPSVQW